MIQAKMHHICIQTNDYGRSLEFYTKCLGFRIDHESPNFHGRDFNTWLKLGDFFIELQTPKRPAQFEPYDKEASGIVHFCLYVDNLDAAYAELLAAGFDRFKPKNGEVIYAVNGGRLLKLAAPEGTIIELRDSWEL